MCSSSPAPWATMTSSSSVRILRAATSSSGSVSRRSASSSPSGRTRPIRLANISRTVPSNPKPCRIWSASNGHGLGGGHRRSAGGQQVGRRGELGASHGPDALPQLPEQVALAGEEVEVVDVGQRRVLGHPDEEGHDDGTERRVAEVVGAGDDDRIEHRAGEERVVGQRGRHRTEQEIGPPVLGVGRGDAAEAPELEQRRRVHAVVGPDAPVGGRLDVGPFVVTDVEPSIGGDALLVEDDVPEIAPVLAGSALGREVELVEAVADAGLGEQPFDVRAFEVRIADADHPLAQRVGVAHRVGHRRPGDARGQVVVGLDGQRPLLQLAVPRRRCRGRRRRSPAARRRRPTVARPERGPRPPCGRRRSRRRRVGAGAAVHRPGG